MKRIEGREAMFFRTVMYGIVAAMLALGFASLAAAAAEKPVPAKWKKVKPSPAKDVPAVVNPQGGITFGEAVSPAAQHRARLRWPEMSQKEIDDLTATLKAVAKARGAPVKIVCKDAMCEDLALNLDNAFESARWKSEIIVGTQYAVPGGVTASSAWLADLFNAATGNRYGAKVDDLKADVGEYVLIGSKPR